MRFVNNFRCHCERKRSNPVTPNGLPRRQCLLAMTTILCFVLVASCGFKNRHGYYYDNHRFNYVRAERFKDIGDRKINHPYTFSEAQMSMILKMVEVNKGTFYSDKEYDRAIFDSRSIGKLTPFLVKAFSEVKPDQRVGFGFLVKNPKFVMKNDRFSNGWMWIEDGKLHIDFDLLYVQVNGDTDKRGYEAMRRQLQNSRGLRIEFDLQPGQEFGASTKELVVDLQTNEKILEAKLKQEKVLAEKGVSTEVTIKVDRDKSVKERMKELDTLRKERLITDDEYKTKKQELMNQL